MKPCDYRTADGNISVLYISALQQFGEEVAADVYAASLSSNLPNDLPKMFNGEPTLISMLSILKPSVEQSVKRIVKAHNPYEKGNNQSIVRGSDITKVLKEVAVVNRMAGYLAVTVEPFGEHLKLVQHRPSVEPIEDKQFMLAVSEGNGKDFLATGFDDNNIPVFFTSEKGFHAAGIAGIAVGRNSTNTSTIRAEYEGMLAKGIDPIIEGPYARVGTVGLQRGTESASYALPIAPDNSEKVADEKLRLDTDILRNIRNMYESARLNPEVNYHVQLSDRSSLRFTGHEFDDLVRVFALAGSPIPSNVKLSESVMNAIRQQPTLIGTLMPLEEVSYSTKGLKESLEAMAIPAQKVTYKDGEFLYEQSGFVQSHVQAQYVDTMLYYLEDIMAKTEARAVKDKVTNGTFGQKLGAVYNTLKGKLEAAKSAVIFSRTYATIDEIRAAVEDIALKIKEAEDLKTIRLLEAQRDVLNSIRDDRQQDRGMTHSKYMAKVQHLTNLMISFPALTGFMADRMNANGITVNRQMMVDFMNRVAQPIDTDGFRKKGTSLDVIETVVEPEVEQEERVSASYDLPYSVNYKDSASSRLKRLFATIPVGEFEYEDLETDSVKLFFGQEKPQKFTRTVEVLRKNLNLKDPTKGASLIGKTFRVENKWYRILTATPNYALGNVTFTAAPAKRRRTRQEAKNILDEPYLKDSTQLWIEVANILADQPVKTFAKYMELLSKRAVSNPTIGNLVDRLTKAPKHVQQEFVMVFSLHRRAFFNVIYNDGNFMVTDADANSTRKNLLNYWKVGQITSPGMVKHNGIYKPNYQTIKPLVEKYQELLSKYNATRTVTIGSEEDPFNHAIDGKKLVAKTELVDFVESLFTTLGITTKVGDDDYTGITRDDISQLLTSDTLERITHNSFLRNLSPGQTLQNDNKHKGIISQLMTKYVEFVNDYEANKEAKRLPAFMDSLNKESYNPLNGDTETVVTIQNYGIEVMNVKYSDSFRNSNGDNVYTFGNNSYESEEFSKMLNDPTYFANLDRGNFTANSWLGNKMMKNTADREAMRIGVADGLKDQTVGSNDAKQKNKMGIREQYAYTVNMTLRGFKRGTNTPKPSAFIDLTKSDKSLTHAIDGITKDVLHIADELVGTRMDDLLDMNFSDLVGKLPISGSILGNDEQNKTLLDRFTSEHSRILHWYNTFASKAKLDEKGKWVGKHDYSSEQEAQGAGLFYVSPIFNYDSISQLYTELYDSIEATKDDYEVTQNKYDILKGLQQLWPALIEESITIEEKYAIGPDGGREFNKAVLAVMSYNMIRQAKYITEQWEKNKFWDKDNKLVGNDYLRTLQSSINSNDISVMNRTGILTLSEDVDGVMETSYRLMSHAKGTIYDKERRHTAYNRGQKLNTNDVSMIQRAYAALDYYFNSSAFNHSMMQTVSGDPAMAYNVKKINYKMKQSDIVKKTLTIYQKRLAKDAAPGSKRLTDKPTYVVAYGADVKIANEYIKDINPDMMGSNATDAQELITTSEQLYQAYAEGTITEDEYKDFIHKVEQARFAYLNGTNPTLTYDIPMTYISGTGKTMSMAPRKPLQVNKAFNEATKSFAITYIKSSSYPLHPAYTIGKDIDKLRIAMEINGIDRFAFESGVKIGLSEPNVIHNSDGTIKDKLILKTTTLKREGFYQQQANPDHTHDDDVAFFTQPDSFFTSNLSDEPIYQVGNEEEKITGKELLERKHEIVSKLYELNRDHITKELGFEKGALTDLTVIHKRLVNDLVAKGASTAVIQMLDLTEDKRGTRIPMMLNSAANRYESLIMNYVQQVIKIKMTGRSFVQGSPVGSTMRESNTGTSDTIYVPGYDATHQLRMARLAEDGVTVLPAEIIVPLNWVLTGGDTISVEEMFPDGVIDPERLPEEFLEMIGIRIPNQDYNSMLPFKVVGFLPSSYENLAIVPSGITTQMGSDFDVDKLNTYRRPYKVVADANGLPKVVLKTGSKKAQLENDYFNLMKAVLLNKDTLPKMLASRDAADVIDIANIYNEIFDKPSEVEFINPTFQTNEYGVQKEAKNLVGIGAAALKSNNTLINIGKITGDTISVASGLEIKRLSETAEKALVLESLSDTGEYDGRTAHHDLTNMLGEFVDYANNRTIDNMNVNIMTYPIMQTLIRLSDGEGNKLSLRTVVALFNQPVMRELVSETAINNDLFSNGAYSRNPLGQAIKDRLNKLLRKDKNLKGSIEKRFEMANKRYEANAKPLTYRELEEAVKDPDKEETIDILLILDRLATIAEDLSIIQSVGSIEVKGMGKDTADANVMLERIDKVDEGLNSILNADLILDVSHQTGKSIQLMRDMYESVDQGIIGRREFVDRIKDAYGRYNSDKEISSKELDQLMSSYSSFVWSSLLKSNGVEQRVRLLLDEKDGLGKRVAEAKNSPLALKNKLINQLLLAPLVAGDTDFVSGIKVVYPSNTVELGAENELTKAWMELLTSTEESERKLGADLVLYSIATGANNTFDSFIRYLPTELLYQNGLDQELTVAMEEYNMEAFLPQYFQHNPNGLRRLREGMPELEGSVLDRLMTDYDKAEWGSEERDELGDKIKRYKAKFKPTPVLKIAQFTPDGTATSDRLANTYEKQTELPPMVSYKHLGRMFVYKLVPNTRYYVMVDTLGSGKFNEYAYTGSQVDSILYKNKSMIDYSTAVEAAYNKDLSSLDQELEARNIRRALENRENFSLPNRLFGVEIETDVQVYDNTEVLDQLASTPIPETVTTRFIRGIYTALGEKLPGLRGVDFTKLDELTDEQKEFGMGFYSPETNTVNISTRLVARPLGFQAAIYNHEMMHGLTYKAIRLFKGIPTPPKSFTYLVEQYEAVKGMVERSENGFSNTSDRDKYIVSSLDEYVAALYENVDFMRKLNNIKSEKRFGKNETLLDKIRVIISDLFNDLAQLLGVNVEVGNMLYDNMNAVHELILEHNRIANPQDISTTDSDLPFAMDTGSTDFQLNSSKSLLDTMRKKINADNNALYELGSKYKIRAVTVLETGNQIIAQHISEGFKDIKNAGDNPKYATALMLENKYKDLLLNTLYGKLATLQRFNDDSTTMKEALLALRIIDNWLDVADMVFGENLDAKSNYLDPIARLQSLKTGILTKIATRRIRKKGADIGIKTTDKAWKELKDDSLLTGLLPSTMSENPAAQIVIKMMKDSLDERDRRVAKFVKGDLTTLQGKLQTAAERRGKTIEEIQDLFIVKVKATSMATSVGPHLSDWRLAGDLDNYTNDWTKALVRKIKETKMNNTLTSEEKYKAVTSLESELNQYIHTVDYNHYFDKDGKWDVNNSAADLAYTLYGNDEPRNVATAKKYLERIRKNGEKFYKAKKEAYADIELQEELDTEATLEALEAGKEGRKGSELRDWKIEHKAKLDRIKQVAIGQKQLWLERFDPAHIAKTAKLSKTQISVLKTQLSTEKDQKKRDNLQKDLYSIYNKLTSANRADLHTTYLANSEFVDDLYMTSSDGVKYQSMLKDPELKAIYDMIQSIIGESMKLLPTMYVERHKFGSNFLPKVTAQSVSVLDNLLNKIGDVPDYMKEWANELIEDQFSIGTAENVETSEKRMLSLQYLTPKADGSLDATNLLRSIELFQSMAVHYDEMAEVEPYVQGAIQLLKEVAVDKVVGGKKVVSDRQIVKDKGQQAVTLAILQNMADERMYLRRNPETFANKTITDIFRKNEKGKPIHSYDYKEQRRVKKVYDDFVKRRNNLHERIRDLSIEYSDRLEAERSLIDIEAKIRGLEHREITLAKIVDANITMSRLRQLGFAPFSAVGNVTAGLASAISYGAGGQYYTNKGFFKSFWFVIKSMFNPATIIGGPRSVNQEFLRNAMTDFGFMDTIKNHKLAQATKTNLETLTKKPFKLTAKFWNWEVNPFILMSETDFLMRASLMVATMSNQKLADGTNVWDNYVANGGVLDKSIDFHELKDRIESINTTVMGAESSSNSTVVGTKYWIVRMLGQYKLQWLPSAINARFGDTKLDPYLRKDRTGWMRDTGRTTWGLVQDNNGKFGPAAMFLIEQLLATVSKYNPKSRTIDGKPLTDDQIANARRTMTDLLGILTMYSFYLLLKVIAGDDDDEEKSALTLFALNMANRTLNDMKLYYSPFDLIDSVVGNGSLPSVKNVKDIYKAFAYINKVIDPEREETWGDYGLYLLKQGLPIPYTAGTMKLISNMTEEKDYNFNR